MKLIAKIECSLISYQRKKHSRSYHYEKVNWWKRFVGLINQNRQGMVVLWLWHLKIQAMTTVKYEILKDERPVLFSSQSVAKFTWISTKLPETG